jgi:hypothetical protein
MPLGGAAVVVEEYNGAGITAETQTVVLLPANSKVMQLVYPLVQF